VEFKREVYVTALTELSRYVPRSEHRNRFLRQGSRPTDPDQMCADMPDASFELPPGATFEPDPQIGHDHA
jgi:putative (di)nucleoside polyphosphate hydrolase